MANERKENQSPEDLDETIRDLQIRPEDVEKIRGGKASDPCGGGEHTPRPPKSS